MITVEEFDELIKKTETLSTKDFEKSNNSINELLEKQPYSKDEIEEVYKASCVGFKALTMETK